MSAEEATPALPDRLAASTDGAVLLSSQEVGAILHLGKSSVFELIASGELRSVKIGRARRVTVAAVRDFVAELEASASL